MSRIVISGASGGAPNRLEIGEFVKNEKFFSLYIQALQAMEKDSQSNALSHFQIGGIHGLPYVVWNGATGSQPWDPNTTWGGYCTHGSVLFPTWHRPYMMLYEQTMQQLAKKIAATYTVDQAAWKQAADQIRQPFWDWALNAVPPDEVIALKQVKIIGPAGKQVTVDNPLYHYTFHPIDPSFPSPYNNWRTTLRQPTSTASNATDNVSRLKLVLKTSQSDITSSTFNMLTRVNTWPAFSNHTVGDGGSTSNSVEAIHDGIHGRVGGSGQMGDPSVAAFDPIFFLHHCNVDRLVSLWAALHPGVWVNASNSQDGTYTIPASTQIDRNTSLTPFWNGQTTFWASAATTDTTKLGYTYPDFNGLDMGNPNAVRTAISNRVMRLYSSSSARPFVALAADPTAFAGLADVPVPQTEKQQPLAVSASASGSAAERKLPTAPASHPAHPAGHGDHGQSHQVTPAPADGSLYEWTARIEFKKYELGCSFAVLIFLGDVPNDPKDWEISPNFVGTHQAFVNSCAERCANCRDQAELVIEGFVHLNTAIIQHSGVNSLDPDVVRPYLAKALHWRVQKITGEQAELPSLEVSVYATPLSYPPGTIFPVPGERHRYNGITYGHKGGSRQAPAK